MMRKVAKRRLLEFAGIVSVVALLAATGFQIPLEHGPVDWHNTTVEGFPAGVTAQQLEAKLGSPLIEDGEAVWTKENTKFELRLRKSRDGYHLTGKRLLLGRQVLAEASEPPLYRIGEPPAAADRHTTESDIRSWLGRGESVMIQNENCDLGEAAEYERAIRYRDHPDGAYEL